MRKKCYRFFGALLTSQGNWLNKMSEKGFRLVRWRPWTEKGGTISTNKTTFNRELLIVEKINDGKPFELHTSYEDKAIYCRKLQKLWFFLFLTAVIMGIFMRTWILGTISAVSLIVLIVYQIEHMKLQRLSKEKEW